MDRVPEDAPFDSDSAHKGADFFVALDPGCYKVTATPVSLIDGDEFEASCDCSTAKSDKLTVEGGYTTEVTLISQCEGDLVGAIDALVLTNTPPTVVPDIENKFNNQCETVEICATGWDPDDDPIEFDFTNLTKGHDFFDIDVGDIELVGYESGHRLWQQCAEIVTEDIADYTVEITAYDLAYDEDGNEVGSGPHRHGLPRLVPGADPHRLDDVRFVHHDGRQRLHRRGRRVPRLLRHLRRGDVLQRSLRHRSRDRRADLRRHGSRRGRALPDVRPEVAAE